MEKLHTFKSVQGREIAFYGSQTPSNKPALFLLGGFHGDEPEGVYLLNRFLDVFGSMFSKSPYQVYVLPCLNPDGIVLKTRENAHHVDLNRNYPTKNFAPESYNPHTGKAKSGKPASEPETQAMMRLVDMYRPVRILSIHSDLKMVDYDGPARDWALEVAHLTGYPFVENVGYPTPGSFGTWAGVERKIALITLETQKAETDQEKEALFEKICPLFHHLFA